VRKIIKIIFVLLDKKLKNECEKKEYFFCVFVMWTKVRVGEILIKKFVSF
jgi:hypothetical protein